MAFLIKNFQETETKGDVTRSQHSVQNSFYGDLNIIAVVLTCLTVNIALRGIAIEVAMRMIPAAVEAMTMTKNLCLIKMSPDSSSERN